MTTRLTRLEAATLGLIVDRPDSGYGLRARLAPGLPPAARPNDGVLRPLLARLARRGLVETETATTPGRERKVHRSTASGRRAFAAWMASEADEGEPLGHQLFLDQPFLKLLFAGHLTPEQREVKLAGIERAAQDRRAALLALAGAPPSPAGEALLAVGLAREDAVLRGVEALREDDG